MSGLSLFDSALLGLLEGITEFLPVSSTGHLILAGNAMGLSGEATKAFEIFIQLGAILAVVWHYRKRFIHVARRIATEDTSRRFVLNLFIAFLPVAVMGLLFHHQIKELLYNPETVAIALIVGGLIILVIERWQPPTRVPEVDGMSPRLALGVGMAQVLSLIPGVSRSAATILGGYSLGLSRTAATEFSFFLAVPTMVAATGYDLLKSRGDLTSADIPVFALGFVVAFIAALIVVKGFVRFIAGHSFSSFAWYRIALGVIVLWWFGGHAVAR